MNINRVQLYQFRNYEKLDVSLSPHLNLITGVNGTGKTNLLEAIYMASRLRSFRSANMQTLVRHGQTGFSLQMDFLTQSSPPNLQPLNRHSSNLHSSNLHSPNPQSKPKSINQINSQSSAKTSIPYSKTPVKEHSPATRLVLSFHKGVKTLKINDQIRTPSTALKETPRIILFTIDDILLVQGSASLRRTFMDQAIMQHYPEYNTALETYTKALRNRNKDIKQRKSFRTWDKLLARAGIELLAWREKFIRSLNKHIGIIFQDLTGTASPSTMSAMSAMAVTYAITSKLPATKIADYYRNPTRTPLAAPASSNTKNSIPFTTPKPIVPAYEDYLALLTAHSEHDKRRGYTVFGPHSDDLIITIRNRPALGYASQGESRILAYALKFGIFKLLQHRFKTSPVLLLDDTFAELDNAKLQNLMKWISNRAQALLTCAQPQLLLPYLHNGIVFKTAHNNITRIKQS
ncbi:DNA replication and repair protein RecF [Spirochaetota bacterium]|nr:DNA replication and repair protein RecF [Spirochaetota bacterium]